MLIDLTCPAEVFETTLPTEEIPAVGLSLYNLSDRVIVSAEVTLKLLSGSGAEKERVVYRARALNGRPHSTFRMNVPCPHHASARSADVTIDKVWFSDNDVWRRELSASVEYTPNALPVSRALTNLKFTAGETAVGFPSQQDGLWVCVCGRPNPDSEEYCARCRRQKELIFARYNRETVDQQVFQRERQLDLATRNVREDTTRMQRIREEEFNRAEARRARRKFLAWCLPLCAAVTAAMLFAVAPALRMLSVNRAMADGNWTAARETCEALGSFPGAQEKAAECAWQEAKAQAETADTREKLRAAADALRLIPDHPESQALAEEADLARARLALADKDTEAAREAVQSLPLEDERRTALENECLLLDAKAQMGKGEYESARESFLLLKDVYPEAAGLASECVYLPACVLIDEGYYEEAIAELNRIPEHPQSRNAILECHYKMAEKAEADGDLEIAASEYLMAGEYGDAPAKTQAAVFALAEDAYGDGDLEAALQLYASLPGYEPAAEKVNICSLALARQALDSKNYDRAAELLAALPKDYENTDALLVQASYLAGVEAAKQKDWEKAMPLLEQAGDYKDAASRLEKATESLVRQRLDAGDAAGAEALLDKIPGSKKQEEYRREAEYLQALAEAGAGGDPEKLEARFEAMGDYMDAPTQAKHMRYLRAEKAEALGETLTAARLYAGASGWMDADERAEAQFDLYYGEPAAAAKEAMENEDYTLAAALLETVDRTDLPEQYADLAALYENACLKAGEALFQAGKPYAAAAYFRQVSDERKTRRWMNSACYTILGRWADQEGTVVAEFLENSTCTIGGEAFTFLVSDSFTLMTESDGEWLPSFRITNLSDSRLSLRDLRDGHDGRYNLFRAQDPSAETAPAAAADTPEAPEEAPETGSGENGPEDFTVKDGDGE